MKKIIILLLAFSFLGFGQTNKPDESLNLALNEDAYISSNVKGRGITTDVLYNPKTKEFVTASNYAEFGVSYGEATDFFTYEIAWKTTKLVNYITFGGSFDNQPQPNTKWDITYKSNDKWITIDKGAGGWIDNNGIYEWKSKDLKPIKADAIKVNVYDSKSIHLRGRGANSKLIKDSDTKTKACLIQLLPYEDDEVVIVDPIDKELQEIEELIALLQKKAEAYNKNSKSIRIVVVELDK